MSLESVRSREELVRAVQMGLRPQYLFFWGHRPLPNGEIGKPCLSQWWPAPFSVGQITYPTAEHFMMAEKARLFGDEAARAQIIQAATPKLAKELGRQIKNFKEDVWSESRFKFVIEGNLAKFIQNHELAKFLFETGDKVLVEASPSDCIWGIGLAFKSELATNPERWRGLNLLGFALMEVRHRLRSGC